MTIESKQTNKRKLKVYKRMENTFVKKNVEENEFLFQNMVQRFLPVNVPKIVAYSRETKTLEMENLDGWMSVSDMFSEDVSKIPIEIFQYIRYIIQVLYDNDIVYSDITGYNFMIHEDSFAERINNGTFNHKDIFIIDFEHAYMKSPHITVPHKDDFVYEFLMNKKNEWNPDFAL